MSKSNGVGEIDRDRQCEDTELIECARCGKVLNGVSLWVVGDSDPETICEDCYRRANDEHNK